jgi:hypothetical protein
VPPSISRRSSGPDQVRELLQVRDQLRNGARVGHHQRFVDERVGFRLALLGARPIVGRFQVRLALLHRLELVRGALLDDQRRCRAGP